MPTNPPVFSMQETTEITAISVFGTEKIPCDINTKFSETERVRENEYTASYAV
jgi:hypothetical protein